MYRRPRDPAARCPARPSPARGEPLPRRSPLGGRLNAPRRPPAVPLTSSVASWPSRQRQTTIPEGEMNPWKSSTRAAAAATTSLRSKRSTPTESARTRRKGRPSTRGRFRSGRPRRGAAVSRPRATQKLLRAQRRREEATEVRRAVEPPKFYGRCAVCESWGRMPEKGAVVCSDCAGTTRHPRGR
jgi:hypothetical protein